MEPLPKPILGLWTEEALRKEGAACNAHQASPAYPRFYPVESLIICALPILESSGRSFGQNRPKTLAATYGPYDGIKKRSGYLLMFGA